METAHDKIRQDKFPMSEQSPENMPFSKKTKHHKNFSQWWC